MKRRKIEIIYDYCKRGCGEKLATCSRSIYGLNELKKKYELICENCLLPEEKIEMLSRMGHQILDQLTN